MASSLSAGTIPPVGIRAKNNAEQCHFISRLGAAMASGVVDIAAGSAGGLLAALVGHPFDTIKVRLQTQPTNPPLYTGFLDCVRQTASGEGLLGFYKGRWAFCIVSVLCRQYCLPTRSAIPCDWNGLVQLGAILRLRSSQASVLDTIRWPFNPKGRVGD